MNDPSAPEPENPPRLAGKRAVVMGLGSFGGGAGAARYLARLGAHVLVTDLRPAAGLGAALAELGDLELEYALGEHRPEHFERADLVVVNPAVKPDHPLLARARAGGARLTSEIELFLEAVRARVVAVTGTQGKSSTVHALARLLELCGQRVHLGGNIGGSLLPRLAAIEPDDFVVLELSSYQLDSLADDAGAARLEVAAVTNVLADHIERHGTVEAYAAAKGRILGLLAPGGTAVLPRDDARIARWPWNGRRLLFAARDGGDGLFVRDGWFHLGAESLARVADLALPGTFQRENTLVALGIARLLGAAPERLAQALPRLRGLDHRLQDLGLFRGRRVIDNAVSTTPDSTISALESVPRGTCLVLGGRKKDLPLDELADRARERVGLAIVFGEAREELSGALRRSGVRVEPAATVEQAISSALELCPPGGTVLFSPACSSFDAYANFRERALAFRAALERLDDARRP